MALTPPPLVPSVPPNPPNPTLAVGIRTYDQSGRLLVDYTTLLTLLDGEREFMPATSYWNQADPPDGYVEYDKTRGEPFFFVAFENPYQHEQANYEWEYLYNLYRFSLIDITPIFTVNTTLGRIEWRYRSNKSSGGYQYAYWARFTLYYGTI